MRQQDHRCKDHENGLPCVELQQDLGRRSAENLPRRPCRRGNAQSQTAVFRTGGTAHHGQNHAKPCARNAKAHQNLKQLMLPRRDRKAGKHKARRIEQRAKENCLPVAKAFRDGAENRLPNTPSKVLNGDRKREV